MRAIIFFSVAFVLFLNANAMSYDFLDPKKEIEKWKKRHGYPVPLETGEKVLLKKDGSLAESLVYLVNAKYETVRDEMRRNIAGKMGIASENETITNEYIKSLSTFTRDAELESILRREFNQINAMGIRIGSFRQDNIKTNKYNEIKKYRAYSVLVVKIIDGRDVFNRECTLIVMTRTDHWRDWGREHHTGLWFPIKISTQDEVVTDTETSIGDELTKREGITDVKYFIPKSQYFPLMDVDMMKAIKEEVETF